MSWNNVLIVGVLTYLAGFAAAEERYRHAFILLVISVFFSYLYFMGVH